LNRPGFHPCALQIRPTARERTDEELEHAGEFLRLLKELAPDEQMHYDEGAAEVENMMKN
jgi:rubrerythrin